MGFLSPDGSKIAFYRFDENEVKKFSMDMFQGGLYPSQYEFRYLPVGDNSKSVFMYIRAAKHPKAGCISRL